MSTILTDPRREVEALAYRAMSSPYLSVEGDLEEIARHLSRLERLDAFNDMKAGIRVRDAARKACDADRAEVVTILSDPAIRHTAIKAAGHLYPQALATARVVAWIAARDWERLEGLDANLDGAVAELNAIRDGYYGPAEYGDEADEETLERLAQEKVRAALADFAFRQEHLLAQRLEEFAVATTRYADRARMYLMGEVGQ